MDLNCLTYWFPLIKDVVPVPRTRIFDAGEDWASLASPLDGLASVRAEVILETLKRSVEDFGCPLFLRTSHTSNKHNWNRTCYLESPVNLFSHVTSLVEFSECAGFLGLPYRYWVLRELLPVEPLFHAFAGKMPIVEEYRCFAEGGTIICSHPYWPTEPILKPSISGWQDKLAAIQGPTPTEALDLAAAASKCVPGAWSVDVLKTSNGWYVTDMAVMKDSYHWEGCVNDL